jgi:hypothetical protein
MNRSVNPATGKYEGVKNSWPNPIGYMSPEMKRQIRANYLEEQRVRNANAKRKALNALRGKKSRKNRKNRRSTRRRRN